MLNELKNLNVYGNQLSVNNGGTKRLESSNFKDDFFRQSTT